MNLRTVLIVAAMALAGIGGYWLGTRHAQLGTDDGQADMSALPSSLLEKATLTQSSLPPSASDSAARLDALTAEPVDDPRAALKRALSVTNANARRQQLSRIGWAWGKSSPEEALRQAAALADPTARWQLQSAIIATWSAEQPEQAFASVAALPADWQRDQLLRQVTVELARRDPRLALQLLTTVKVSDPGAYQIIVADEWSRFDPAGAAKWVETMDRRRQGRLAYEVADAYIAQQPSEALEWALRISHSPGRNLWSHMVGLLAQQDPQQALSLAQSADNPAQRMQAMGAVLRTIAAEDPALAISYLNELPAGPQRTHTSVQIALQMAEASPDAAVEWLGNLPDRAARSQGLVELGSTMAWEDVDGAARLVDRVPDDMRLWWITTVARSYVSRDVDRGIEWVRKFENEPGYESLVQQFASELAVRSPDAALALVDRTVDDARRDQMLLTMVTSGAGKQSPETAARWVAKISDEDARARAVEYLASEWGQYDLPAARKWVMSQPTGPSRDRGLTQLAMSASTANDAITLIEQIQSRDQRMNAVMQTAERLNWSNPEEVRTLLRRHPLDPQRQQQLDMMLQRQSGRRQ